MERRDAQTIRFPAGVLQRAREVKEQDESINQFVVEAVEREIARREGLAAIEEARGIRERVRARYGVHPDSVPLIRALREGEERRD